MAGEDQPDDVRELWFRLAVESAIADLEGLDDPEFFDVVLRGNPPAD